MLEKATLRKCFDFCEGPYDFLLVENIPVEHRARVRLNGWRGVKACCEPSVTLAQPGHMID
jgi:hypothetical protein